jgi:hypothetical protein
MYADQINFMEQQEVNEAEVFKYPYFLKLLTLSGNAVATPCNLTNSNYLTFAFND